MGTLALLLALTVSALSCQYDCIAMPCVRDMSSGQHFVDARLVVAVSCWQFGLRKKFPDPINPKP